MLAKTLLFVRCKLSFKVNHFGISTKTTLFTFGKLEDDVYTLIELLHCLYLPTVTPVAAAIHKVVCGPPGHGCIFKVLY